MLTLYVEGIGNAIRASGGTLSYVEFDSICALFGHEGGANAAQGALRAAGAIEGVIADLNNRLGRQTDNRMKIAVSIHGSDAPISPTAARPAWMLTAIFIRCRFVAEPVVEVGDHALDCAGRPQGRLRGVGVAFVAKQRADAVELHIAERAAGGADGVAEPST